MSADKEGFMKAYPYKFHPIYREKIWGGRNLERLLDRSLPHGAKIGESWDLADLNDGVSVVANGPETGKTLTELTAALGTDLIGHAAAGADGRFPLLLKLLDANDILSLQVHPDTEAAGRIGGDAAPKDECWYVMESRNGYIYKGVQPGATPEQFRKAVSDGTVEKLVQRVPVKAGQFHHLPAGTVHALGPGVVVAEVQAPSNTTYRITDWGRGRDVHVERSMQCIRFDRTARQPRRENGDLVLETDSFSVAERHGAGEGSPRAVPSGRCAAVMFLDGGGVAKIRHAGQAEPLVLVRPGETVLLPACLRDAEIEAPRGFAYLLITLPERL